MTSKRTVTDALQPASARERLLAAATELFYEEGVNTVGIDRVIERAGVAKASLYNTFGSKDELVRAYLQARLAARQARFQARLARHEQPREKILAIFDLIRDNFADPAFRGCAFVRASSELKPGSCVKAVCDESRSWLRGLFGDLARQAGVKNAAALAQQLELLHDGVLVSAQMDCKADHKSCAALAAKNAAAALLDAAIR
jgi:AcrR family transcriptional regulator